MTFSDYKIMEMEKRSVDGGAGQGRQGVGTVKGLCGDRLLSILTVSMSHPGCDTTMPPQGTVKGKGLSVSS